MYAAIISAGLIDDDAAVACNGVTACDHAKNAATAIPIPIVPVEKNTLRMIASFVFVNAMIVSQRSFRTVPLPWKSGVVEVLFVSSEPGMSAQIS